jgi:hypothetical protein
VYRVANSSHSRPGDSKTFSSITIQVIVTGDSDGASENDGDSDGEE